MSENYPDTIIIGRLLVSPELLGIREENEYVVYEEEEIFIPRILKKYGFFGSTSEVKRNRPDLWREVNFPEFTLLKIGRQLLHPNQK